MPGLSLGLGLNRSRVFASGVAPITTSRAFNSSNVQVGPTNTGDIPADWVKNQATVTSVTFANDNSVTSIGSYAFAYTGLTSVTIPNSVTFIFSHAFRLCTSLTSIIISENVTSIEDSVLEGCSNLTTVTFIPTSSVMSIGNYAFKDCTSLTSITIPSGVTSIGSYAFASSGLTSITIPTSVTSIGSYAFAYTAPTSITIPNSVTSVGQTAFAGCGNLATATIGTGVTGIGTEVFRDCTSLATVSCYVAQSAFTGSNAFYNTASPLVIQARITDASWTAGVGLTFQGNTNVTVIKNL